MSSPVRTEASDWGASWRPTAFDSPLQTSVSGSVWTSKTSILAITSVPSMTRVVDAVAPP
jgi:hypothetical protein